MPRSVAQRLMATLFIGQSLASAAFIATVTVNPIVGAELSGQPELAGLPGSLALLATALAAYPFGRWMQASGRRIGLTTGFLIGAVGMALNIAAVAWGSFALFLLGISLLGVSRGATEQARYAAADVALPADRGKAISTVVFAGTVGAVGGPALVAPLGQIAVQLGLPELAGPMLGGSILMLLATGLIAALLRPDPRSLAITNDAAAAAAETTPAQPTRTLTDLLRLPAVQLALAAMVIGQATMVLVMSVTSLHMRDHNHGLDTVSIVISGHTLGMFGLSMLTGYVADRFGRPTATAIGALLTIAGALIAPLSLQTPWLALGLFLVGLGWNFCYIAGSSLLSATLSPSERGATQGAFDTAVNLASGGGSLLSGFILASAGYGWLCLIAAIFALIPLVMAFRPTTATPALKPF